jgi:DNA-binding transcriptional LysR family regulator
LLPVLKSRLFVVLPATHPLAVGRKSVKLADLAEESWGMLDEKIAPGYRPFLIHLCRLSGFTPKFGPATATIEGVFGRVASGYGVALAPESIVPKNSTLLRCLPSDCEPLEFCAVWHRQEKSVLLQQYLEILRRSISPGKQAQISPS